MLLVSSSNSFTALICASRPSTLIEDFYNSTGLELLYAYNYAYSMPIIKWVRRFKTNSAEAESRD